MCRGFDLAIRTPTFFYKLGQGCQGTCAQWKWVSSNSKNHIPLFWQGRKSISQLTGLLHSLTTSTAPDPGSARPSSPPTMSLSKPPRVKSILAKLANCVPGDSKKLRSNVFGTGGIRFDPLDPLNPEKNNITLKHSSYFSKANKANVETWEVVLREVPKPTATGKRKVHDEKNEGRARNEIRFHPLVARNTAIGPLGTGTPKFKGFKSSKAEKEPLYTYTLTPHPYHDNVVSKETGHNVYWDDTDAVAKLLARWFAAICWLNKYPKLIFMDAIPEDTPLAKAVDILVGKSYPLIKIPEKNESGTPYICVELDVYHGQADFGSDEGPLAKKKRPAFKPTPDEYLTKEQIDNGQGRRRLPVSRLVAEQNEDGSISISEELVPPNEVDDVVKLSGETMITIGSIRFSINPKNPQTNEIRNFGMKIHPIRQMLLGETNIPLPNVGMRDATNNKLTKDDLTEEERAEMMDVDSGEGSSCNAGAPGGPGGPDVNRFSSISDKELQEMEIPSTS